MLKGESRVSRIRSAGVATPSRQKVRRLELRIQRPAVVALADAGKELVGGERQRADGVDLVHEDDQRGRVRWEAPPAGVRP